MHHVIINCLLHAVSWFWCFSSRTRTRSTLLLNTMGRSVRGRLCSLEGQGHPGISRVCCLLAMCLDMVLTTPRHSHLREMGLGESGTSQTAVSSMQGLQGWLLPSPAKSVVFARSASRHKPAAFMYLHAAQIHMHTCTDTDMDTSARTCAGKDMIPVTPPSGFAFAESRLFGATLTPRGDGDSRVVFAPLAFEWAEGPAAAWRRVQRHIKLS